MYSLFVFTEGNLFPSYTGQKRQSHCFILPLSFRCSAADIRLNSHNLCLAAIRGVETAAKHVPDNILFSDLHRHTYPYIIKALKNIQYV